MREINVFVVWCELQSLVWRIYILYQKNVNKIKFHLMSYIPSVLFSAVFNFPHFSVFQEVKQAGTDAKTEL